MQYPQQPQSQQPYYDHPQQYYAAQQVAQPFRAVQQQYSVQYGQVPVQYSQYQTYQKPVQVTYHQPVVPAAEPWVREPQQVLAPKRELMNVFQQPAQPPRREKPPPRPAPAPPVKPVQQQRQAAKNEFVNPPQPARVMFETENAPGGFDILGRGNLPSIEFESRWM